MLYHTTLCAACGKKGAHSRCMRCLQTAYCDKKCQRVHWRAGHKRECKKTTDTAASTTATVTSAGTTDTAANQSPGDDPTLAVSTAATATATAATEATAALQKGATTSSRATANECNVHAGDDDQLQYGEYECPICMDNPDTFIGHGPGEHFHQCFQCGQLFCGPCKKQLAAAGGGECPTCRASFRVSNEVKFGHQHALVHARSPGRHTPVAQSNLGIMYENGTGVAQDYHEAVRMYTLAATQDDAHAQYNLACMYETGTGVAQDYHEAARLFALAAAQGFALAQCNLGLMHARGQGGLVPDFAEAARWCRLAAAQGEATAQPVLDYIDAIATLPINTPGMRVQVFGLTSANGLAVNGREGLVQDQTTKPGRAAVLLDGDTKTTSISTTNLRKASGL